MFAEGYKNGLICGKQLARACGEGERHPEAGATADRFRHINPAVQRPDPTQAPILAT